MAMTFLRSLLFNVAFFGGSFVLGALLLPALVMPRRAMQWGLKFWAQCIMWTLRVVARLEWEVKGLENLPAEPALFACKHQSAWETGIFYLLIDDPAYILKKELLAVPLFGWFVTHSGAIAIDRKAGASALKNMVKGTRERLARGQNVVIFPEGTRAAPGAPGTYHPGVAAIYKGIEAPVVPVALNSGLFWRRRGFVKHPGRITIEFLPPVKPGLDRKTFMATLQNDIEQASNRLIAEAREHYPRAMSATHPDAGSVEK